MSEDVHSMDAHPETGLPIEQCPGRGDHHAHNWNIYDPTAVKLSRVNLAGERTCLGYSPFAGITSPDGEAIAAGFSGDPLITPVDWQRRLSASVAAHAERQALRRHERAEFARRRNYGLERRHAAKTARLQPLPSEQRTQAEPTVSQTETDPTVGQCPANDRSQK